MSVTPPLSNAVNVQVTDGTNAMPTGDTFARGIATRLVNDAANAFINSLVHGGNDTLNIVSRFALCVEASHLAFNGVSLDRVRNNQASTPLATVAAAKATQTSADQVNYNGKGLLLHVKFANLAGSATFTPRLQWKDNSGNYNTIWTAAAAIAANADKTYQLYPGAADLGSHTEEKQLVLPRTFRIQLVYAGNGTTDAADVTADMEILL